jgi:hypothetical protein
MLYFDHLKHLPCYEKIRAVFENAKRLQKSWFAAQKFCANHAMQVLDLAAHLDQNYTLLQMFLSAKGSISFANNRIRK